MGDLLVWLLMMTDQVPCDKAPPLVAVPDADHRHGHGRDRA
jgi:hypothetical protein